MHKDTQQVVILYLGHNQLLFAARDSKLVTHPVLVEPDQSSMVCQLFMMNQTFCIA